VLVIGTILYLPLSWVHADDLASLTEEIQKLATHSDVGGMRTGIRIELIHPDREIVYEQLSDASLKPASNQKLLTTAAAFSLLPSDFTYRTILARRGEDLIVIGSGDPAIGDPRYAKMAEEPITGIFHDWAESLKKFGLTEVKGDLLFDDYVFEQEHVHPTWRKEHNLQAYYSAPVGGLNFNDNCVDVVVQRGPKVGAPAVVELIPNTPWVTLDNKGTTGDKGSHITKRVGSGPLSISVTGVVTRSNSRESPLSIAIVDPGSFFASTCRTSLSAKGIRIDGETRRQRIRREDGSLPPEVELIAVYERKLDDIYWRINKTSMNLFAEALLKTLGAYVSPDGTRPMRVGSTKNGVEVLEGFLKSKGIPLDGVVLDDGSGLSHSNRVTASVITAVLAGMDSHPRREEFWESLAVPGEDPGTLRSRLKDLSKVVRAKTGHINGVSTLSGYVIGTEGRRYAFSVLCNDTQKARGGAAHKLQDRICKTLAEWKPALVETGG
jgi:D-alanyl-D-alanine carboxypeptidase/D-alanyl-D-alanine-endopeptidase (penicillin-binding protein 4)